MLMRHYVIFRSPCRIQTPSRSVSCTGVWVQIAELEMLLVLRHLFIVVQSVQFRRTLLLHHSYTMLLMYSSQYSISE